MRIAALDIGGTTVKSGIWTPGAMPGDLREQETGAHLGGAHVMGQASKILRAYGSFDAIGVSTAGQVDPRKGCIRYANENIPGYTGMQVRRILEEEFHVPVAVENDVNAAAVGEGQFGAGREFDDFLCVTYGTGVGGAVVLDKKVYGGSSFSAGEFGGIMVHPEDSVPGDPFRGCYEKYASTTALVARAMEYDKTLDSGRKIFARMAGPGAGAAAGDMQVARIVDTWTDEIAYGLVTLIHIFNPACVVLGGGVMAQETVLEQVREKTLGRIMESFRGVRICRAELGNVAGLMGAAYLAWQYVTQDRARTE